MRRLGGAARADRHPGGSRSRGKPFRLPLGNTTFTVNSGPIPCDFWTEGLGFIKSVPAAIEMVASVPTCSGNVPHGGKCRLGFEC